MIDKWLNKIDRLNPHSFFWWIIGFSILLAAWEQYIQHGWITKDSVLYLEQARLFVLGDWQGMVRVHNWPFYGACIGIVHKLTSLNIHVSAQLLNMLFFGMATASFLQLIKLVGGNNRTWFMGALLLFSSPYIVDNVLKMLLRDEGFWAFYLASLVFFIRYIQQHKIQDALLWQLCIIIATLFRIEAILLLILLPVSCITFQATTIRTKILALSKTYVISLFIGMATSIAIWIQPELNMFNLSKLNEALPAELFQVTKRFFERADIMSNRVLGSYLDEFAMPGLLLTLLYVITFKIISATGVIGFSLAIFGIRQSSSILKPAPYRILRAAAIIMLIAIALTLTKKFILSVRYTVALVWILLIFAGFYFTSLSLNTNKKARIIFIIICIILGLSFIKNVLPKREGYLYAKNAVAWLKQENKSNNPVFYNETRLRYYADERFIGTWADNIRPLTQAIKDQSIFQYGYLVLASTKKETKKLQKATQKIPEYQLIKQFDNAKHKKFVLIYKKKN